MITGYSYKKAGPGWVVVELDGGSSIRIRRDVFDECSYEKGSDVSSEQLREAEAVSGARHARSVALRFLSHRPRTIKEMNDRLSQEDLTADSIEAVIADLTRSGYLDDEQFARMWAESRASHRPRGRRVVSQELSSRGVSRETIESVLDSYYPDDADLVRKVATRRAEIMRGLDKMTFRRRLSGYLARRGFGFGVVAPLLDELWDDPRDLESD